MEEQNLEVHEEYKSAMKEYGKLAATLRNRMRECHGDLEKAGDVDARKMILRNKILSRLYGASVSLETLQTVEIFGRYGFGSAGDKYVVFNNARARSMADIDIRYIFTSPGNDANPVLRFGWLVESMVSNGIITFDPAKGVDVGSPDAFFGDKLNQPAYVPPNAPFLMAYNLLVHKNSPLRGGIKMQSGQLSTSPFF